MSKIETRALLDVSRKSNGGYAVRSFEELSGCELSQAIRCVGEPLLRLRDALEPSNTRLG